MYLTEEVHVFVLTSKKLYFLLQLSNRRKKQIYQYKNVTYLYHSLSLSVCLSVSFNPWRESASSSSSSDNNSSSM